MSALELSLVLPCFNEAKHLRQSAIAVSTVLEQASIGYEVLFVDDGSTDGTRELLPKLCQQLPHMRFVLHRKNRGRGAAFKTGFEQTTGRITGYIDVDLEVHPSHIPSLVRVMTDEGADVVLGKREYDLTQLHALDRVVISRAYRLFSKALLGVQVDDTETGFKFFNRERAAGVIRSTASDGWFFDTEVSVLAERAGLKLREVPVPFVRRTDKVSSVRLARDVRHYLIGLHRLRRQLGVNVGTRAAAAWANLRGAR